MRIYVDKLQETCWKCPFFIGITCRCKLLHEYLYECVERVPEQCPIHSLSDYTKQVRKEVVDIIEEKFNCCGYVEEKFEDIKKYVLDQIEQGKQND